MGVYKKFLEKISNLDDSIKTEIEKMNLPYPLIIHVDKTKKLESEINKIIVKISELIPKKFGSSIPYVLGELTDNIEQHSNYSNAFIFLKYDSEKEIAEICIFDDGLTIPSVFKKSNLYFLKDSDAIKMALRGKTTKKEDISRGFGLKTTKSIVEALNGKMQIISKSGMVTLWKKMLTEKNFDNAKLCGTLIYLKMETPEKDLNIYSFLE